uniref:Fibrinogen alpha/beta/gamma chain coiled coil domain-containing protein n=1 Tax=Eptatretus burgeri TaxID=7764 RepID=A0A8C4Q795_EPTBU
MGLLYLFITVALITCQGNAEEMTPRGPRPNMPGAQSKQQCSPRDYDFCTDDVKGKVCPSGCRLAWLMRDGEQRIGSQLNSLVTRVNAIVNRGKTLVVNFRQAHNQANTILSESNVVDESHGKMLNRLEQYVLHIQNRIDIQLKRLQQLRAVLLAQLQNILRLETSHTSHSSSYTSSTGEGEREFTFPGLDLPTFDSLPAFEESGSRSSSGGLSSSSTFTSSSGSSPVVLSASTLETEKMPSQSSSGSHSFSSSTSSSSHSSDLPFGADRSRVFDNMGISASMRDIMSKMTTDHGLMSPSFSNGADSMRGEMASTTSHHSKTVTKRVWVETLSNGTKVTRTEITHSEGGPAEVTLSSVGGADGKTTLQHEVRGLRKRRSKKTSKHH